MELFTRTTRRVELTSYGQTFLPYARTIARTEFERTSAVKRLQNTENGLLTIASIPSMPQYQITMFIAQFQQFYPNTTVRITEDDSNNLLEYLLNGTCELIFTREDKLTFEKNFMTNNHICQAGRRRVPVLCDILPRSDAWRSLRCLHTSE